MLRNLEDVSKTKSLLLEKINSGILSMLCDYNYLYNDLEIKLLEEANQLLNIGIEQVRSEIKIDILKLKKLFELEIKLKPFCYRCWQMESVNGFNYISWFKEDKLKQNPAITSATFFSGLNSTFCNSRYGIKYDITIEAFLGACEKDAATLIEEEDRHNLYTIAKTIDGKVINSYNLATTLITPKQVFCSSYNTYLSKHNEIILDSRYITPVSVVYFDDNDLDMVTLISQKYTIPIETITVNNGLTL
ncbi:MAG: hypothetical protein RR984_01555 [Bacilli bacterium]